MSLLLRLAVALAVYALALGGWHPSTWGAWTVVIATVAIAVEAAAWQRIWDTRVAKTPHEAEEDAVRRAAARYDRPNILN
jgi:hypothetical protein